MFENDVKKLKTLTKKLKVHGDITEDEADWIYILRKIHLKYCTADFLTTTCCSEYDFKNNFKSFSSDSLSSLSETFHEWYETVYGLFAKGTGNFITTVPMEKHDFKYSESVQRVCEKKINDYRKVMADALRGRLQKLCDEGIFEKVPLYSGRLISGDVTSFSYCGNIITKVSRLGIVERLLGSECPGNTKDINYVLSKCDRIKSGHDISIEEADNIYMLFKYAQALYSDYLEKRGSKEFCDPNKKIIEKEIHRPLRIFGKWYKAVRDALREGRKGNFLYTVPYDRNFNLHYARRYIEEIWEKFPDDICYMRIPKNPRLLSKIEDIPLDFFKNEISSQTYHAFTSSRYGTMERNGISINDFIPIAPYTYENIGIFRRFINNLSLKEEMEDNQPCPVFVGKMESLKTLGVYPIEIIIGIDDKETVIGIHKDDYEKAKYVISIPDHELYDKMPIVNFKKEDADETARKAANIIMKIARTKRDLEEAAQEDDWILMDR